MPRSCRRSAKSDQSSNGRADHWQTRNTVLVLLVSVWNMALPPCQADPPVVATPHADAVPSLDHRPTRLLELVTGEQFVVEWLMADKQHCQVRWNRRTLMTVPWTIVAAIRNPHGWIDVEGIALAPEDRLDGRDATRPDSGPQRMRFDAPLDSGLVQAWLHQSADSTLELARSSGDVWRVHRSPDGSLASTLPQGWKPDFRQRLRWTPQRTLLQLYWNRERYRILLDFDVLEAGATHATDFTTLTFDHGELRHSESSAVAPVIVRRRLASRTGTNPPLETGLTLTSGDVLKGGLTSADARGIVWSSDAGDATFVPWTEFAGLRTAAEALPPPSRLVTGTLIELRHRTPDLTLQGIIEQFRGARVAEDRLDHPYLGSLPLEHGEAEHTDWNFRSLSASGWQWLQPAVLHLGDDIDTDVPVGPGIAGEFPLPIPPQRPAAITLTTWGLEPCGPKTPREQPFLTELMAGGLRTRLIINDVAVADLNELIQRRAKELDPDVLHIPLPEGLLRAGVNRWEIRQIPLSPTNPQFDDCRIGRIALETE